VYHGRPGHGSGLIAIRDSRPGPVVKASSVWVFSDIPNLAIVVISVADYVVEILNLPDLATSIQLVIHFVGSKGFPRVQDAFQRVTIGGLYQHMNVVGHDDGGMNDVSFAVEMVDRVVYNPANRWFPHETSALASV